MRRISSRPPRIGTHSRIDPPLHHGGDRRNGTERFPSLRMPGIVPSNRRLRFDGPPFSAAGIGDPASPWDHLLAASPAIECYAATSAVHLATISRNGRGAALLRCGDLVIVIL